MSGQIGIEVRRHLVLRARAAVSSESAGRLAAGAIFDADRAPVREAALGLGASQTQVVFHHVLPLALPGMLTGTIIGYSWTTTGTKRMVGDGYQIAVGRY